MNLRNLVFFAILFPSFFSYSQWISIQKSINSYQWSPTNQFVINPFTNHIWFVRDNGAVLLDNNGTFSKFSTTELGDLYTGIKLKFTFTPTHTYYCKNSYGLFSFDNNISQSKFVFNNYLGKAYSDSESVFILGVNPTGNYVEYNPLYIDVTDRTAQNMAVKNGYTYVDFGSGSTIAYYPTIGMNNFLFIHNDNDYVGGNYNEMKFSRHSDTLFVAGKKGISKAYNYDFFDTITPNNSTNMPSANVLEIEFDHNDSLWAVFGDINDVPFAIAKLEGYTWTNHIDANNSPIDFTAFFGLEIDTLGNLWVADDNALHTLLTPNSPAWLNTPEISDIIQLEVFPNPFKDVITIRSDSKSIKSIEMTDVNGRIIYEKYVNSISFDIQTAQWEEGIYFLKCQFEDGTEHLMKVTK
jgi:hypothetical protein